MKKLLTILAFITAVVAVAQTKETGDSALAAKNYEKAIEIYEKVLKTAPTTAAYTNLGNAYYRNKNMPKAILNYQRALKVKRCGRLQSSGVQCKIAGQIW